MLHVRCLPPTNVSAPHVVIAVAPAAQFAGRPKTHDLKMHDLKRTDKVAKNNGVWKMTDWKMTEFLAVTLSSLLRF